MQPNIYIHESFGKFLFITFDLLCGYLILKINEIDNFENKDKLVSLLFWFYNPVTITISSRGNSESLMSFLVLAFILFIKKKSFILAGIFYALSIHYKIYPLIYGMAITFYITKIDQVLHKGKNDIYTILKVIVFNKNLFKFASSCFCTFSIMTVIFYIV